MTVSCLTYGLLVSGSRGLVTVAVVGVALAAGAGFVAVEVRAAVPMVDPRLLRSRPLSGGAVTQMLWGVGVNGVFFFTSLLLQRVLGFSPTRAGLAFLPLAGVLVVATPLADRLTTALGAHRVVPIGLLLVAAGLLLVSAYGPSRHGVSFWRLQPGLLLVGGGSALTTSLTTSSLAEVPAARAGTAAGLVSAAREVSGALGVVLIGAVLTARQHAALRAGATPDAAFVHGYAAGLRLAAALVACGAVVAAVTLRVTPPQPDGSTAHVTTYQPSRPVPRLRSRRGAHRRPRGRRAHLRPG
jgi:predicted MFS family arabinose efflux permease